MSRLFLKKPLSVAQSEGEGHHLSRILGPWSLTPWASGLPRHKHRQRLDELLSEYPRQVQPEPSGRNRRRIAYVQGRCLVVDEVVRESPVSRLELLLLLQLLE